MNILASKRDLVHELFVRTADENYVTARWCAINNLNTDFFWLAVHALEKYLKAVLLLNGCSSKRSTPGQQYSHNIVCLYANVKVLAGLLLPEILTRPAALDIYHWSDRPSEQFMEHLIHYGNAHNRYLIYGYVMRAQDLHMLDAMVFAIRRLICPLDGRYLPSDDPQVPTYTHRDILIRQPDYYECMSMPLDDLISAREESPTRTAALNLNMAFAPQNYPHGPNPLGLSARIPVIVYRILEPLESDDARYAAEGIEIARWFLGNVQVPGGTTNNPGVKEQIEAAIETAKAKHGIP